MTITLGKFIKDENDLFEIMYDWLRRYIGSIDVVGLVYVLLSFY